MNKIVYLFIDWFGRDVRAFDSYEGVVEYAAYDHRSYDWSVYAVGDGGVRQDITERVWKNPTIKLARSRH